MLLSDPWWDRETGFIYMEERGGKKTSEATHLLWILTRLDTTIKSVEAGDINFKSNKLEQDFQMFEKEQWEAGSRKIYDYVKKGHCWKGRFIATVCCYINRVQTNENQLLKLK